MSDESRYQEIMAKNTAAINLCDRIEKTQRQRRTKAFIRWWWNKLTFRGYKNERQKATKGKLPFKGI
jgi:hypothetical protein